MTSVNDRSNLLTASHLCYVSNFPLHRAVRNNDIQTVKYMLSGFSELQLYEILTKHLSIRSLGALRGGELDPSKKQCITMLHIAVDEGHNEIVKYIMTLMPNNHFKLLQWKDEKGQSALHAAVAKGATETVRLILNSMLDFPRYNALKICIEQGKTVLHSAISRGHHDIVKCILESVPNKKLDLLKLQESNGNTPLLAAAIEKRFEVVLTILQSVTRDMLEELQKIKNNQNQDIFDFAAAEIYYCRSMTELSKQNTEIDTLKGRCNQQEKALEKADKVTAAQGEQIKRLENRNNQLEREKEQLAADLGNEISGLKAKCKRQSNDLANQSDNIVTLRRTCDHHSQELNNTRQEVTTLRESYVQQGRVTIRQAEELRNTGQEMTELRESYVQQTGELQQLRHNHTEMLKMIEALQIYLGKPTTDQENETDNDN